MLRIYLFITLFFLCVLSIPAGASGLYAEVDAMYGRVEISNEDFKLPVVRAKVGTWLWDNIGIEAMIGASVDDDDQANVDLDIPTIGALYGRFQSPGMSGFRAYILLGAATLELDGDASGSGFPGKERFTGGMAALGVLDSLPWGNSSVLLEYSRYFVDEEIDVDGFSLGLRYDF